MEKHIAIYVRVSSSGQNSDGQELDLKRWADAQAEPVRWYYDQFTGTTMDRPGFHQIEMMMEADRVSTLVVWRLDRLGRTALGLHQLFDDLQKRKVNLVSLKESFSLNSAAGRLMATLLTGVAVFETEARRERQAAGIAAAKAQGRHLGRPFGTKCSRIPPEKRRAVFDFKRDNWRVVDIARAVGLSRKTIYQLFKEQRAEQGALHGR